MCSPGIFCWWVFLTHKTTIPANLSFIHFLPFHRSVVMTWFSHLINNQVSLKCPDQFTGSNFLNSLFSHNQFTCDAWNNIIYVLRIFHAWLPIVIDVWKLDVWKWKWDSLCTCENFTCSCNFLRLFLRYLASKFSPNWERVCVLACLTQLTHESGSMWSFSSYMRMYVFHDHNLF